MFRRIGRAFKEAFWGLTHHFGAAFSTAVAIVITLLLVNIFAVVIFNISEIAYDVESDIQIYAPISETVAEEDLDTLKTKLERIPGIAKVTYSSKEDELNSLIASFGEDGNIFALYSGEDNPLPRVFLIQIESEYSISQISSQVELVEGMDKASYGGTTVESFISLLKGVRTFGLGLIGGLLIMAIFLISNTINLTIDSRKQEIGIMRLIGASNGYIRSPLIIEGIIISIVASIIPIAVTVFGYTKIYDIFGGQIISGILRLVPPTPFIYYISLGALAIAVAVGFIGSYLSATVKLRGTR